MATRKLASTRQILNGDYDREIYEAMARAMFVSDWADRQEEKGKTYPGMDLMDVAPPTSRDALLAARALAAAVIKDNNVKSLTDLYARALNAGGEGDARKFGHYLAMQAMGHGVSWYDDGNPEFGLKLPHFEYYSGRGRAAQKLGHASGTKMDWKPAGFASGKSDPKVVTRQFAYLSGEISLCKKHDNDKSAGIALGPVSHGLHVGECVVCEREWARKHGHAAGTKKGNARDELATINERGNGLPVAGDYVGGDDGELYRVVRILGRPETGGVGAGLRVRAQVRLANWDDCSEEDVSTCLAVLDAGHASGTKSKAAGTKLGGDVKALVERANNGKTRQLRDSAKRQLKAAGITLVRGQYGSKIGLVPAGLASGESKVAGTVLVEAAVDGLQIRRHPSGAYQVMRTPLRADAQPLYTTHSLERARAKRAALSGKGLASGTKAKRTRVKASCACSATAVVRKKSKKSAPRKK